MTEQNTIHKISSLVEAERKVQLTQDILFELERRLYLLENPGIKKCEPKKKSLTDLVRDRIKDTDEIFSSVLLALELGFTTKQVSNVFSDLSKRGEVERVASRHYKWTKKGANQ